MECEAFVDEPVSGFQDIFISLSHSSLANFVTNNLSQTKTSLNKLVLYLLSFQSLCIAQIHSLNHFSSSFDICKTTENVGFSLILIPFHNGEPKEAYFEITGSAQAYLQLTQPKANF